MNETIGYEAMTDESCAKLYYLRHPNLGPAMLRDGFPEEMVTRHSGMYAEAAAVKPHVMSTIREWLKKETA